MRVRDLMTTQVASCTPQATLADAARLLWEKDCGVVPVLDGGQRLVGILTDRDVCMAAYIRGRALGELDVAGSMAKQLSTCHADDSVAAALGLMASSQVRRIPVVGDGGRLVGILSLNDVARAVLHETQDKQRRELDAELVEALAAISEPRHADMLPAERPAPKAGAARSQGTKQESAKPAQAKGKAKPAAAPRNKKSSRP